MGYVEDLKNKIKSIQIRQSLHQLINLGMIVATTLVIWKGLMVVTGTESPVVVVLSGSMEPGFQRVRPSPTLLHNPFCSSVFAPMGDILFLYMSKDPIRSGEIVVYSVDGRDIPIVHRVIEVHERKDTKQVDILTKGDNNDDDDVGLYVPEVRLKDVVLTEFEKLLNQHSSTLSHFHLPLPTTESVNLMPRNRLTMRNLATMLSHSKSGFPYCISH